jgi:hypothetical protein
MDEEKSEERMILAHEPVPGYKKIFHILIAAAVLVLGIMFLKSFT